MTAATLAPPPPPVAAGSASEPPFRRYTGHEWIKSLGNVPLDRILFDPPPGTATEADMIRATLRGRVCELIDGTLVEKAVGFWEERLGHRLGSLMDTYAHDNDLGITNGAAAMMRVTSGNLRGPDVTFTAKARVPTMYEAFPTLSPDLIVEVLSPSNTGPEITRKLGEFFAGGTRLAWVIDPAKRTAAVYRGTADAPAATLDANGTLDGEDVLPGFSVRLADLFAVLPTAE